MEAFRQYVPMLVSSAMSQGDGIAKSRGHPEGSGFSFEQQSYCWQATVGGN